MSEVEVNEEKEKLFNLVKAVIEALRRANDGSFEIHFKPPLYLTDNEFKSFFDGYDDFGGFVELGGYYFAELYYITSITKNDKDSSICTENRKHITIMFRFKDNNTYEVSRISGKTELEITDCP
jgi:hypothetical protein